MKIMNENKKTLENQEKKEWVFLPLLKAHILKRTDTFVLFDVDGIASGIVSAKFLRKKETDDYVFLSVPADYEINVRVREKNLYTGKWETKMDMSIKAVELAEKIRTSGKNVKVRRLPVGPVVGAHAGPGTVGCIFVKA